MTLKLTSITEADDYSKNVNASSKVQPRALLLNAVVYGNPHKLYNTDTSASSLGSGYHSVGITAEHTPQDLGELIYYLRTGDGSPWT